MRIRKILWILVVAALFSSTGEAQKQPRRVPVGLKDRLKQFFTSKEAQARTLLKEEKQEPPPEMWDFFKAGQNGQWSNVESLYGKLRGARGEKDKRLLTMAWQPLIECEGAFEAFTEGEEKYVVMLGREILDSMPPGSVYFGANDAGRWLPTIFSKSHPKADPVFTLTQNGLADALYLKYIRTMYGDRLTLPTDDDSQKAFSNYVADAGRRLKEGKLKPGEDVKEVGGQVQVAGQMAVIGIYGRLARTIFNANPKQEFFIAESFPLDWMYPYLSPNGPIMKINRNPVTELSDETVQKDRDYWIKLVDQALGQWLTPQTSVKEVCDFARAVFLNKDPGNYHADPKFMRNAWACKNYSKLRSSIAGLYAWRAKNSGSANEKPLMTKEADFAFRQAFALCPDSPEVVFRYVNLLIDNGRKADALLLAQTAELIDPRNSNFNQVVQELERDVNR